MSRVKEKNERYTQLKKSRLGNRSSKSLIFEFFLSELVQTSAFRLKKLHTFTGDLSYVTEVCERIICQL